MDVDGVSRASTDSFLDDVVPLQDKSDYVIGAGATRSATGGEAGVEHVTVESPNSERISTGNDDVSFYM